MTGNRGGCALRNLWSKAQSGCNYFNPFPTCYLEFDIVSVEAFLSYMRSSLKNSLINYPLYAKLQYLHM
jgi:hypothetical protein